VSNSAQQPPRDREPPPPKSALERLGDVATELVLISVSALAGIGLLLTLGLLGIVSTEPEAWSAMLGGPALLGGAALTYYYLERALGEPSRLSATLSAGLLDADQVGRRQASVGTSLLIALVGTLVALTGSVLLGWVQESLFSIDVEEQQTIVDLVARQDPIEIAVLAISAVVLAPLTEELLFRHMFFRRLYVRVGPIAAWTLPALAFALSHYNPVGLVIYVWLGSVFAMAYLLTGRLWVAMLVHAGQNAYVLMLLLATAEEAPIP
jgi:membrane protease YdiL (CAAX protease family)